MKQSSNMSNSILVIICLILALAAVQQLPFASSQTVPGSALNITRLTLGFAGALTLPNVNAQTTGQPGLFAFKLALARINSDPTLLPGIVLTGEYVDTKSDASTSVNGAYDLINTKGVVGIVGEAQSTQSQMIQYVCKRYQIAQISYASASMDFTTDHVKIYPYFLRALPHVALEANSLTYFLASQGWKKIALAFTSDSYGSSGSGAVSSAAKSLGIQVLVSASWNSGQTDVAFQINQIIQSKARIIVYWGVINDLLPLWRLAATMTPNILGDGYQWIAGRSVLTPQLYTNATGSILPDILQYSQGLIGTTVAINWTEPEGVRMWNDWKEAAAVNTNPQLSVIDKAPTDPNIAIPPAGSFAYDSTMLMAYGLHDMIYRQGLDPRLVANRQQFYNTLVNISFTGVTGNIRLNSVGDRVNAPFSVVNLDSNKRVWQTIADISIDQVVANRQDVQIQYHGNDPTKVPLDSPIRPVINVADNVTTALQLATSIIIFFVLLLSIFVFVHRGTPVIKSASPTFLLLMLLGVMSLCSSIFARTIETSSSRSDGVCVADLFLTNLGYYFLVGSLLVKTYRLKQIFLTKSLTVKRSLRDRQMLLGLIILVVLEGIMLLVLCLTVPMKVALTAFDSDSDYYRCTSDSDVNLNTYYFPITISFRFVLLVATAYYSYTVRNINSLFNESRQLLGTIYNLLFCSILLPAIDAAMDRGKKNTLIAYAACVFLICVATTIIMFYHKVKSVLTNEIDSNYVTSATSANLTNGNNPSKGHPATTNGNFRRGSSLADEMTQRRLSAPVSSKQKGSSGTPSRSPRPLPVTTVPKRAASASIPFAPAMLDTKSATPNSSHLRLNSSPISSGRNTAFGGERTFSPPASPTVTLSYDYAPPGERAAGIRVHMDSQMLSDFFEFRDAKYAPRTQPASMEPSAAAAAAAAPVLIAPEPSHPVSLESIELQPTPNPSTPIPAAVTNNEETQDSTS